jgi:prepilin-type N-terminal cleavage/methylation domain-containing protein
MDRKLGFTLIELLVTMTIVVILIAFGVVGLRNSQITGRDDQRKNDIAVIAQHLENYYRSGSTTSTGGRYPPTASMGSEPTILTTLRDIEPAVLRAPGVGDSEGVSLKMAINTSVPAPDTSTYMYQPLQSNGALCVAIDSECRKFNLFYKLESSNDVQKINSKHQ